MADGLTVFYGEFLVLPAPLELSGNWCSHSCSYCFANLAVPNRRLDFKGVMALLTNHHKRKGLAAKLLQLKYPTLISNHIDPFSKTNAKPMVDIMRYMTDLDLPIYFQTKGGEEQAITEALEFIKPSVFYVSITHQDDESRKLIEPNAPSMEHRYELIREVVSRGHRVVCGINPLHPEWMPEPEVVLSKLKDLGVEGVWIELLHLSNRHTSNMKDWQKKRLGEHNIKVARRRYIDDGHQSHYLRAKQSAEELGLHTCRIGQPGYSEFYQVYHETYERTFPVMQDFINHCIVEGKQVVTWEDWLGFFGDRLPKVGTTNQHIDYIRQGSHLELTKHFGNLTRKTKFNYSSLLHTAFKHPQFRKMPFSPWAVPSFAPVTMEGDQVYKTKDGGVSFDSSEGDPLFFFDPEGQVSVAEMGLAG